jgi:hypothetical protein
MSLFSWVKKQYEFDDNLFGRIKLQGIQGLFLVSYELSQPPGGSK